MWDVRACRGCLNTKCKLEKQSDASRRLFASISGIPLLEEDGYPRYLCVECNVFMRKAITFRRKVRRAYFMLKQIIVQKHEILYTDICRIDRHANNLISPYGYWRPEQNGLYIINHGIQDFEMNEDELDLKTLLEIEKAKSESLGITKGGKQVETPIIGHSTNTVLIVDIPPEKYACINDYDEKDEKPKVEDFSAYDDYAEPQTDYETQYDTGAPNEDSSEALLDAHTAEDVFKDLKEGADDDSDCGLGPNPIDLLPVPTSKRKRSVIKKELKNCKIPRIAKCINKITGNDKLLDHLTSTEISPLSEEEQIEAFAQRQQGAHYVKAQFKCGICLTVCDSTENLIVHVAYNHNHLKPVECVICTDRFDDESLLEIHNNLEHKYRYDCTCHVTFYNLNDFLQHHLPLTRATANVKVSNLTDHFTVTLLEPKQFKYTADQDQSYPEWNKECMHCALVLPSYFSSADQHSHPDAVEDQIVRCDVCKREFYNKDALAEHFTNNHSYAYKCEQTNQQFFNREDASLHMLNCQFVFCKTCRTWIKNRRKASIHMQKCETILCQICNTLLETGIKLWNHMVSKHHDKCAHCTICGTFYSTRNRLVYHQLMDHHCIRPIKSSESDLRLKCASCEVHFESERAYKMHLIYKGDPRAKYIKLACLPCKQIFDTQEELDDPSNHKGYVHQKGIEMKAKLARQTFPGECEFCGEMLVSLNAKILHLNNKHPEQMSDAFTICEECGEFVKTKYIKQHIAHNHRSKSRRPINHCPICDKKNKNDKQTVIHILRNHTPSPYVCSLCNRRFVEKAQCKSHIMGIHVPAKPYECSLCSMRFSTDKYLDMHRTKIHGLKAIGRRERNRLVAESGKYSLHRIVHELVFTYPHMKLDVTLVPRQVLEAANLVVADYTEQKFTPMLKEHYNQYLLFDVDYEQLGLVMHRRQMKHRGVKTNAQCEIMKEKKIAQCENIKEKKSLTYYMSKMKKPIALESADNFYEALSESIDSVYSKNNENSQVESVLTYKNYGDDFKVEDQDEENLEGLGDIVSEEHDEKNLLEDRIENAEYEERQNFETYTSVKEALYGSARVHDFQKLSKNEKEVGKFNASKRKKHSVADTGDEPIVKRGRNPKKENYSTGSQDKWKQNANTRKDEAEYKMETALSMPLIEEIVPSKDSKKRQANFASQVHPKGLDTGILRNIRDTSHIIEATSPIIGDTSQIIEAASPIIEDTSPIIGVEDSSQIIEATTPFIGEVGDTLQLGENIGPREISIEDLTNNYEITNFDGEMYVTIEGVLYKIEH